MFKWLINEANNFEGFLKGKMAIKLKYHSIMARELTATPVRLPYQSKRN